MLIPQRRTATGLRAVENGRFYRMEYTYSSMTLLLGSAVGRCLKSASMAGVLRKPSRCGRGVLALRGRSSAGSTVALWRAGRRRSLPCSSSSARCRWHVGVLQARAAPSGAAPPSLLTERVATLSRGEPSRVRPLFGWMCTRCAAVYFVDPVLKCPFDGYPEVSVLIAILLHSGPSAHGPRDSS